MALTELPGWLQRCLGRVHDASTDDGHAAKIEAMDKRQAEMLEQLAAIEAQADAVRIARAGPPGWRRADA